MSADSKQDLSRRQFMEATVVAGAAVATVGAAGVAHAAQTVTVAGYICRRLKQEGADILFGVPGATCDAVFIAAGEEGMDVVATASDLEAGYAADGYARFKGISAVAVTYSVGTMALLSVVGGALAERSPMVIVNGGPSDKDLALQRDHGTFYTHSTGRENTDLKLFREVTGYAARIDNPADTPRVVDEAIRHARTRQEPVYIEVPQALWYRGCAAPTEPLDHTSPERDSGGMSKLLERLTSAKAPVLMAGIEVQRLGLQDELTDLIRQLGIPWVSTLLAKAVVAESTPGFAGVYMGRRSMVGARSLVEDSDLVLAFGVVMGRQLRKLATSESLLRIGEIATSIRGLSKAGWTGPPERLAAIAPMLTFADRRRSLAALGTDPGADGPGISYDDTLSAVADVLTEDVVVITDTSLSMYPAAQLPIQGAGGYLSNAVWQAIGFSAGAAVGVGYAQKRRPLVICGDGGFQMTAQSLSTMARYGHDTIVVVLDNGVYGIEKWLLSPGSYRGEPRGPNRPYVNLNRWKYADLARSMGIVDAVAVDTVKDLQGALANAMWRKTATLISVAIQPGDLPDELRA
jgi:indolepyruvate decarboxylase